MNRIKEKYLNEIVPKMISDFKYKNKFQVPKLLKIVVNMGMGEAIQNPKMIDTATEELKTITGQKPIITKARKSIANFKLRAGMNIGVCVTLRGEKMYSFFDRLLNIALPRVRDFKGVSPKAFDGNGNYSLGIKEQIIFSEINYDKVEKIKGFNVTINTSARTDEESLVLLRYFGMPFRK